MNQKQPIIDGKFEKATCCHQDGKFDEAKKIYREILELESNHWPSLGRLGLVMLGIKPEEEEELKQSGSLNNRRFLNEYSDGNRFVSLDQRNYYSFMLAYTDYNEMLRMIKEVKRTKSKWKECILMKDPYALGIYMQLFQQLRPKTIIELGVKEGGSLLWMNDVVEALGIDCELYGFDIDTDRVKDTVKNHSNIRVFNADLRDVAKCVRKNSALLESLSHPILFIEDAHANPYECLVEFSKYLCIGDYIVAEDTADRKKYNEMRRFIKWSEDSFIVDTYYCDFYGYNNSANWNSYFRKVR